MINLIILLISIYLVYYDIRYLKVKNIWIIILLLIIIGNKILIRAPILDFIFPGCITFLTLIIVYIVSRGKLGMGDIKYSTLLSIHFGYIFWLGSTIYASILALTVALILLFSGKIKRKAPIPFIPFIVIGSLFHYFLPIRI